MTEPAAMKELVAAIRRGDADAVRALVAGGPSLLSAHDPECFGATALIHAANCDDREVVDVLLDAGADIDERSDWWAGSFGVLDSAGDDLSEHLLERGATLSPHAAARLGMAGALRAMIEADPAVVHLRGGDGQFPLHFARTAEIADLLLDAGADIDARDIDHESTAAQWLATARPGVAAYLVARGCETDPFLLAVIGDSQRLEAALAADPDDIDVRVTPERFPTRGERAAEHIYAYTIGSGFTLLHAAALADRPEIVGWLVAHGCDPEVRGGYDDQTPLHTAAWNDAAAAARALLDAGAAIDARSGEIHRNEPLGWAIVSGAPNVARLLLERGATVRDNHRDAATRGAGGEFRDFNRRRPIHAWQEIAVLLAP